MSSIPKFDASSREEAIAALFNEHNRALVRFLETRLSNRQEAKDVAQEAYVRLLELERTGAVSFFRAYLYKTASNLAIDRLRAKKVRDRADTLQFFDEALAEDRTEQAAAAAQAIERLWDSLLELPLAYRQALVMHRVQDLSCEIIGQRLDRTARMVRRYIVSALLYCHHRLEGVSREQAWAAIHHE